MVAAITPLVAGAYTVVGLFYASMATLNGQGRPLPVALAFFFGAFLVSPSSRMSCPLWLDAAAA